MCLGGNKDSQAGCKQLSQADYTALLADATAAGAALVILQGRVYRLNSGFVSRHPGGRLALANCHGTDATIQFSMYHPESARRHLAGFCVGQLLPRGGTADTDEQQAAPAMVQDYFRLLERLESAGLFQGRPWHELWIVVRTLCLLVAAVTCVVWLPDSWLLVGQWTRACIGGCLLGLYWQQLAFVGHDLGHTAVTQDRVTDQRIAACIGDAFLGISIGWWKQNHNTHHLVTNSVSDDPDIQHMPLLAVTDEFFESPASSYYDGKRQPFIRWLISIQHLLFYPIMCVARFYLYVRSFEHLLGLNLKQEKRYLRLPEIGSMLCFFTWVLALTWHLEHWQHRLAFLLISHAVSGLLHVQICLSHFPMSVCRYKKGELRPEDSTNDCARFIRGQVASTMDITCPPWLDWLHGGLQFQLEHHLFPRMPRQHLRSAVPMVHAFCRKHGLQPISLPFFAANAALYNRLKAVAAKANEWRLCNKCE